MENDQQLASQQETGGMMAVQQSRAIAEVQAQMAIAKRFPRDTNAAFSRIIKACQRRGLAEQAVYAYPRGGQTVTGPSVRLAEALAQNWGNLDFGIVEVEQRQGESVVMAYCTDIETNVRQQKTFVVKHIRETKKGNYALTDGRDIYELIANQGARRLRACILGTIPGDIVEAAEKECEKTLAGKSAEPLQDRARKMLVAFAELGVTQEMIEKRLTHKLDALAEAELVQLQKIYRSIKDGFTGRAEWFEMDGPKEPEPTPLADKIKAQKEAAKKPSDPKPAAAPTHSAEAIVQEANLLGAGWSPPAEVVAPEPQPVIDPKAALVTLISQEMARMNIGLYAVGQKVKKRFNKKTDELNVTELETLLDMLQQEQVGK